LLQLGNPVSEYLCLAQLEARSNQPEGGCRLNPELAWRAAQTDLGALSGSLTAIRLRGGAWRFRRYGSQTGIGLGRDPGAKSR
jgi:hypothetical protein